MKLNRKLIRQAAAVSAPAGAIPLAVALEFMPDAHRQAYLDALKSPHLVLGDIGDYDTATLIEVLYAPAQDPTLTGFWLQFFQRTITFDTQEIRFDAQDINEYRLAPFVSPNVQGRVLRAKGFSAKSIRPAYVKPKHVIDPTRAIPRRAGERPLGSLSLQERFDAIVADNLRRERAVIENRWDWMAARATIDGSVTIAGEDYPTVNVDFGRDASCSITLAGAAQWSASTAVPLSDLSAARINSFRLSRAPITRLIMGLDAWSAFTQSNHPDVQRLLDGLRKGNNANFNDTGMSTGAPYEYQGQISGFAGGGKLDLWTYHYQYEDASGTFQDYMDQGTVVGVGTATEGIRLFGAILDKGAQLQPLEIFPKQWDEEDPSVSYTMSQSAPLMYPIRPNNSFKMKVV